MTTPTAPAHLREFAASLQSTVLGHTPTAPTANRALTNPRTASAFAPQADVRPVDLGDGLWAALRTSATGEAQVLCVHNVAAHPVDFDPAAAFPTACISEGDLLFLAGRIDPAPRPGTHLRLPAHSFVWLGHFTA